MYMTFTLQLFGVNPNDFRCGPCSCWFNSSGPTMSNHAVYVNGLFLVKETPAIYPNHQISRFN